MTEIRQIISANDLLNGDVIYFTAQDTWSRDPADAREFTDSAAAETGLARASAQPDRAVGPYLIDLNHTQPVRLREQIRRAGPTVGPHNTAPRGGDDAIYSTAA